MIETKSKYLALLAVLLSPMSVNATPVYWNVFNIEGESSVGADIATYSSLIDMLADSNRISVNTISGSGRNIVGSGSDGSAYWNVFNIEGESSVGADIVTYSSLLDMLADSNRTSVNTMSGAGRNIVGSGASFSRVVSVPEPGILALFGVGLAGLGLTRRRCKGLSVPPVNKDPSLWWFFCAWRAPPSGTNFTVRYYAQPSNSRLFKNNDDET